MSRARPVPRWAARAAVLSLVATTAATGGAALAQPSQAVPAPTGVAAAATSTPTTAAQPKRGPEVDMETLRVPLATDARVAREHDHADAPEHDDAHGDEHADDAARLPVVARLTTTRTDQFGLVGVTWPAGYDARGLHVELRTHDADGWSEWDEIAVETVDVRHEPDARAGTLPAWVGDADGVAVRLLSEDGSAPEDVRVALIDGGTGLAAEPKDAAMSAGQVGRAAPVLALGAMADGSGVVEQPDIVTRAQWGVDSSTESTCSSPTTADTMRGIVLHHTAGSNDYTPAEAPGIVRAVHRYHTVSQRWCDIGYNFLVDKYGTVYEGRRGGITNQVRGAHAGDALVNKWTTGISMMGHFEGTAVPAALKDGVVRLAAWRLWLFGRDAVDTMLIDDVRYQRLSGHRDFKSTACPGAHGYAWLNGGMREEVQAVLDAAGPAPTPTEPTPTEPTPTEPPTDPEPTVPPPSDEPRPEPLLRYSGDSRYATAASIAEESFPNPVSEVFLASGAAFPDALSGGPAAALRGAPVLLTRPHDLPAETAAQLDRLRPQVVHVLGGEGAVSAAVLQQVQQHAPSVQRLAGGNRYATGVAIAQQFWTQAGTVYLASGDTYPDALSGGALAAQSGSPILLSAGNSLPSVVAQELTRLNPGSVVLLGGPGALGDQVAAEVSALLPGAAVERLGGATRFATSAAIAQRGWSVGVDRAYLAAGSDFPDALAGVPAAASGRAPLLLTRRACVPPVVQSQLKRLSPEQTVLLGGEAVLTERAATHACAG